MSARAPRRTFATPFVVTLAAVPACYVQSSPQPPPPQNPQVQPAETEHQPPQPVVVSNPPRPQPETQPPAPSDPPPPNLSVSHNPPRPQPNGSWHVYKTGSGCEAAINIQCPAGATCNPPPPQKYDCPPGIVMGKPINIITDGNGGCIIEPQATSCPPNVMCNPPRPTQVACPK